MLGIRHSPDEEPNAGLRSLRRPRRQGNVEWVERTRIEDGVILVGGCSVVEFHIRVAQSRLRRDLLPSFWSLAGILRGSRVHTVADVRDLDVVPESNGVQTLSLREFDDPARFPNIALIEFTRSHATIGKAVEVVRGQRSLVDIPELIVLWVAYVWGAGAQANPLLEGKGLPSAAFVEAAHALAGVDLTPGLASEASCPEAIWQAAKWWTSYYEAAQQDRGAEHGDRAGRARAMRPRGRFFVGQPSACVPEPAG
ncbi:MAG: hypothetical protein V3V67_17490 [Myxococcota bacterium]